MPFSHGYRKAVPEPVLSAHDHERAEFRSRWAEMEADLTAKLLEYGASPQKSRHSGWTWLGASGTVRLISSRFKLQIR
jgi:hypothetical protein